MCGSPRTHRLVLGLLRPVLVPKRIEPEPIATVGADFQFQVLHRVDHPLVFVIFLQQRIGLDHAFDQPGGAAEFPGLRIDRDRDAVVAHHGNMVRALEYVLVIDLGAELAVQLRDASFDSTIIGRRICSVRR